MKELIRNSGDMRDVPATAGGNSREEYSLGRPLSWIHQDAKVKFKPPSSVTQLQCRLVAI